MKSFAEAKRRLERVLGPSERAELSRRLASGVLAAAGEMPAFVACDDEEVAAWARSRGAAVLWTPGLGLSGAVAASVVQLAQMGHDHVVVAHSDLPFVTPLDHFGSPGEVTIAPDRHRQGTNVMALPSVAGFSFSYGPGSFERHRTEAARLGLRCRIVDDWHLAADIDEPGDLLSDGRAEEPA